MGHGWNLHFLVSKSARLQWPPDKPNIVWSDNPHVCKSHQLNVSWSGQAILMSWMANAWTSHILLNKNPITFDGHLLNKSKSGQEILNPLDAAHKNHHVACCQCWLLNWWSSVLPPNLFFFGNILIDGYGPYYVVCQHIASWHVHA